MNGETRRSISPTASRSARDISPAVQRPGRAASQSRARLQRSRSRSVQAPTVRAPSVVRTRLPLADATIVDEAIEASDRIQVMVVGLGMVGIAFIEKLLDLDTAGRYFIRTCGEEPTVAYNRVGLTDYFQHRDISNLYLNPVEWYASQDHFAFHIGEKVVSIDADAKTVHTSKGNAWKYDILVLSTGSTAPVPGYVKPEQRDMKGVFVYRSVADLDAILANADGAKTATVVGGGLLGLEAAKAVYDLGLDVSIQMRGDYLLSRQLDAAASELVHSKVEDMGVKLLKQCRPTAMATKTTEDGEVFAGFETPTGTIESDMVIYAVGITPRDDLATQAGLKIHSRGGIEVGDDLTTSFKDVYAIGECANWQGNLYGLIAPGIEMADILAFNLTQTTGVGAHSPRKMNAPDLSTRLKLMGVDVASFGDYFADQREQARQSAQVKAGEVGITLKPSQLRANGGPINCLTYHDPFSATYKKYIFSADGRHLLGGMMIGDVGDFAKLVAICKKKKKLDVPPAQFILGSKKEGGEADELDDDAVVCSCHNVTKGAVSQCVKDGMQTFAEVKAKTKAGSGCGGCVQLVTSIFNSEMKKAGHKLNTNLCVHFPMSRVDLLQIVKVKRLKTFREIMDTVGKPGAFGCEICKPAIGSILASTYNEHVMAPAHHALQDTNDRYMANIQRNGTFSVVPRLPGGEVTPAQLVAIGQVAAEFNLYTKVTGGQRIDMFGAQKPDLPVIWERLQAAGLESGQAYAKSLRTVKSCVGTSWCRFGVGDSVGLAIELEKRYRGVRAPHKFKGAVSGCVRECAEAQSKDFGLIATDKGWNIFIGGNGGVNPRHAILFAQDVPPTQVIPILDRYIMFYVRTADRLVRTAPWVESFDGGIEKLRRILLDDELGICADLEADMASLVDSYEDEWKKAVEDPKIRSQFRQFVNTPERQPYIEQIAERGQTRAADWPKEYPPTKFGPSSVDTPESQWAWVPLAKKSDLPEGEMASAAVKYGDVRLALFRTPHGYHATQQMCPHKRAFVLDHGIVGDSGGGVPHVSCPLHKRNFKLDTGECTNDPELSVLAFKVKLEGEDVLVQLPPLDELENVLGTEKWMTKQGSAGKYGGAAATTTEQAGCASGCSDPKLEW